MDLWERALRIQRSLFRMAVPTAPDPLLSRTLVLLRDMDWVDRASLLDMFRQIDPAGHEKLLNKLGPDEAVDGKNEALPPARMFAVVACPPAAWPTRQLTLADTFARQVRRRTQD